MVNKKVVEIFGDTPKKKGGNVPIWLCYENLGIEFNFLNNSWNDTENPIIFICICKPLDNQKTLNCNLCLNQIKEKSFCCENKCNLVIYCSKQCFDIHYPIHSKYCKKE